MGIKINTLNLQDVDRELHHLADLLHACVHHGASVSFVLPFSIQDSFDFWRNIIRAGIVSNTRVLIVARVGSRIAGTVQLDCDTPPNQVHRADVSKLLVHPDFRRRGVARALMAELEVQAIHKQRWLLTLDTRSGDNAEPLYMSIGYQTAGSIPCFAKDPHSDKFDGTTYMFKKLRS
ncbi:MAG: GNAT family N-acetyltransferase [Hyphomicrobiales bacterium]